MRRRGVEKGTMRYDLSAKDGQGVWLRTRCPGFFAWLCRMLSIKRFHRSRVVWQWQRITRVSSFEVRGPGRGYVSSVMCEGQEQLAVSNPLPAEFLTSYNIALPVMRIGTQLVIDFTSDVDLEIRPLGEQVS